MNNERARAKIALAFTTILNDIIKNTDVSEENTVLDDFFSAGLIKAIQSVEEMYK